MHQVNRVKTRLRQPYGSILAPVHLLRTKRSVHSTPHAHVKRPNGANPDISSVPSEMDRNQTGNCSDGRRHAQMPPVRHALPDCLVQSTGASILGSLGLPHEPGRKNRGYHQRLKCRHCSRNDRTRYVNRVRCLCGRAVCGAGCLYAPLRRRYNQMVDMGMDGAPVDTSGSKLALTCVFEPHH